ncbi:hypothetical protein [Accumulibacter sp.]|uniref:hypothetical protein n=1 Tax=Accumulibacter sp. TaxID=2053492 RepID=UPI0026244F95|nr:hypothetical protein [Accumulibacter sp.]
MLLALENAIVKLLRRELPSLFTGPTAAEATFSADSWDFDRLSADPIASESGPEDAVDELLFDPDAPAGPHSLTRPPCSAPKRVYLRSSNGELVALRNAEVVWSTSDPASFSVVPGAGRNLAGCNHLHVMYGVVATATRLRMLHKLTLQIAGPDASSTEVAFALALSVLVINRDVLARSAGFSWTASGYQVDGSVKTLKFTAGSSPATALRNLSLEVELDLRLEHLLEDGEASSVRDILSPRADPDEPSGAQRGGSAPLAQG